MGLVHDEQVINGTDVFLWNIGMKSYYIDKKQFLLL